MTDAGIDADLASIARIDAIPSILEIACRITGLRFAAVARVTETKWVACAVRDEISFGLAPGGELDLKTTICDEIRSAGTGVIIDHVAQDAAFRDHHTPRLYGFQSYISIPIFRGNGSFFGTLCALDPLPAKVSQPSVVATFENFARLIGLQLDAQEDLMRKEAALADAGQLSEVRERFIAVLGHDLRNPAASILAGADLLDRGGLDARGTSIVRQIRLSAHRIAGLTDHLLDFARGRLGSGLPLDLRPVTTLSAVLEGVVAELQIVHPERRIVLDLRLVQPVTCDPDRIAQLLSNLLGNALTHGASDEPVEVSAASGAGEFSLSVSNGGAAIPDAAMATLFQPFTRAAPEGSRTGLGLGLFIASEIAKAHGGLIVLESAFGRTRFLFTMPCAGPAQVSG